MQANGRNTQGNFLTPCPIDKGKCLPAVDPLNFFTLERHPWRIHAYGAASVTAGSGSPSESGGTTLGGSYSTSRIPYGSTGTTKPDFYRFVVTTEDGTRHVYEAPTLSSFNGLESTPTGAVPMSQYHVDSWRLIASLGPTYTQPIPERGVVPYSGSGQYASGAVWPADDDPGAWVRYEYSDVASKHVIRYVNAEGGAQVTWDELRQRRVLSKIVTPTHTATFTAGVDYTQDPFGTPTLTSITLTSRLGGAAQTVQTVHLESDGKMGPRSGGMRRLDRVRTEGHTASATTNAGTYVFSYHNGSVMTDGSGAIYNPPIGSGPIDQFGYYREGIPNSYSSTGLPPWTWALSQVQYPTGASETFEYESDRITNAVSFGYGEQVRNSVNGTYTFSGASRVYSLSGAAAYNQGGSRLLSRTASDGLGTSHIRTYTYGAGNLSGIPSLYWRTATQVSAQLYPGDFGEAAVYYETVTVTHADGSKSTTSYTSPTSGHDGLVRPQYAVQTYDNLYRAILSSPEAWSWGLPYHTDEAKGDGKPLRSSHTYLQYVINRGLDTSTSHSFAPVDVFPALLASDGSEIKPRIRANWVEVRSASTSSKEYDDRGGYSTTTTLSVNTYDDVTGLVRSAYSQINGGGGQTLSHKQETVWAWELYRKGGAYARMLDRNLLTTPALQTMKGSGMDASAAVTTFSQFRPSSEDTEMTLADASSPCSAQTAIECVYLPHRAFAYRGADSDITGGAGTTDDDFGAWLRDQTPTADWIRTSTTDAYNVDGSPTRTTDATGLVVDLFYGSSGTGSAPTNSLQFSNATSAHKRSRLTGVRTTADGVTLQRAIDYDSRNGLVSRLWDANNRKTSFAYDGIGRLTTATNDANQTVAAYAYSLLTGSTPNRVITTSYGTPTRKSYAYFDGWGRQVQAQSQESGTTYLVTGTEYDLHSRPVVAYPAARVASNGAYQTTPNLQAAVRTAYASGAGSTPWTRTTFEDAPSGRPIRIDNPSGTGTAATSITLRYALAGLADTSPDTPAVGTAPPPGFASSPAPGGLDDAMMAQGDEPLDPDGGTDTSNLEDGPGAIPRYRRVTTIDETGLYSQVYVDGADQPFLQRSPRALNDPAPLMETRTTYDGAGRVLTTTTPEGRVSAYQYNRLGQLTRSVTPDLDGDGTGGPTNETLAGTPDVEVVYDDAGRPRFTVDPVRRGTSKLLYTTYDAFGRVKAEGVASSTGSVLTDPTKINSSTWPGTAGTERTEYEYDTATPSKSTGGLAVTNPLGRLVQVAFNSASASAPNDGYYQYSYDNFGNVTGYNAYLEGLGIKRATYAYDRLGTLLTTAYQHGVTADRQYFGATYDALGRAVSSWGNETTSSPTSGVPYPIASATFDAAGRATQTVTLGTVTNTLTYDVRSRLTGITATRGGATVFSESVGYALNSRITDATFFQPLLPTGQPLAHKYAYTYDATGRLTGADYFSGTSPGSLQNTTTHDLQGVSYDRDGNIKTLQRQRSGLENYTYNYTAGSGRLNTVTGSGPAGGIFFYDRNGAMTGAEVGQDIASYSMGRNGLPFQVTNDVGTTRYLYDGVGQRVYASASGGRYTVRGAHGEDLAEYTGAGALVSHSLGGGRREASGARVAYVTDHLGSVRLAVDTVGQTRAVTDYYPFGLQMPGRVYVQGTPTREDFTGHELDQETNLHYAGARYYSAALGRFTSTDPHAASYPGWSPYHYAANNPVSVIDPAGTDWVCATDDEGECTSYEWRDGVGSQEDLGGSWEETGYSYIGTSGTYTTFGGISVSLITVYGVNGDHVAGDWHYTGSGTKMLAVAPLSERYAGQSGAVEEVTLDLILLAGAMRSAYTLGTAATRGIYARMTASNTSNSTLIQTTFVGRATPSPTGYVPNSTYIRTVGDEANWVRNKYFYNQNGNQIGRVDFGQRADPAAFHRFPAGEPFRGMHNSIPESALKDLRIFDLPPGLARRPSRF
ncbi:hypothetical protein BSZ36_17685 [Rubricoccus marinus]|uniref:RHS repeat-associated core domain-containing protein n=1 Tax=Rubricoccus marinus TaxID=716817 RepID=A0A259TU55_9BACT|nr:hypothetical protein BSZ36_17685 [Rubricoccus marinus]